MSRFDLNITRSGSGGRQKSGSSYLWVAAIFFIFYMQNFYFYFWRKKNSNTLYNLNVGVRIGTYCGSHLLAEDAGRNVVVVGCRMLLGWWCDDEK